MITATPPHRPHVTMPRPSFGQIGRFGASGIERVGAWADDTLQAEERILEPDERGRKRTLRQPAINRPVH